MALEVVKVEGLKGVLDTLKSLPPEIVSKNGGPVRSALRKAAKVLQAEVQANLQRIIDDPNVNSDDKSTGLLMKNIVVSRSSKYRSGEMMVVRVRSKRYPDVKGKPVTTAQVARLLESGTEKRRPYPFVRPAFDSKKEEAVQVFTTDVNKRIASIIKKLERQNKGE